MNKIIHLLFWYFVLGLLQLSGQIISNSIQEKAILIEHKNVFALQTDANSTFDIAKKSTNWKIYDSTFHPTPKETVWIKFEIENKSSDTITNYLYSPYHYTTIYQKNDKAFKSYKNGPYFSKHERSNQLDKFYTPLKILAFQKSQIYVRLDTDTVLFNAKSPEIYSENNYLSQAVTDYNSQTSSIAFIYFYIISLVTIFIFAIVFWLRLRQKLYFYYLGYLLFQIVYGLLVLKKTLASVFNIFEYFPKIAFAIFEPTQFVFIGFYILFILHLLQINNNNLILGKTLKYLGISCFIYALSSFTINYFVVDTYYTSMLFYIVRSVVLPINFLLIFWIIYKVKHPLINYFIVGQSFFFIGAVLATFIGFSVIDVNPGHFLYFKQAPNIIFQIGLLAEVYCFSLALGHNVFLLQKDKEKANSELIEQLQQNQNLQQTMNKELDDKVNQKTDELIKLYSEIERKNEQKIKDDFTQKIRETEMIALRSQMNPHFIFNSMNAIKNLMMTSRNDDAIAYLDDFSSLLRSILQNSNRKKITVEEELEILELYLSLENSRMGDNFNYIIQTSSKEELSQYQIPPLLLQPIVENAIWHGLRPSLKAQKNLKILFDTTANLKIIIEDNGIGRKESAKTKKLHNSMGTTIVQDRLTLYNHLNDHDIYLEITDLEEDGTALGTRITLTYNH